MSLSVRYAAGAGAAVAAPGSVLLAATSPASAPVREIWTRMLAGLDRRTLLVAMTESGLVRLDSFALLLDADHGGLVLVRGDARVVLHTADGDVPVGTSASSTWTEVALPTGTTGAELVLGGVGDGDAEIPATAGVFPAARLVVDLAGAGAGSPPSAPAVPPEPAVAPPTAHHEQSDIGMADAVAAVDEPAADEPAADIALEPAAEERAEERADDTADDGAGAAAVLAADPDLDLAELPVQGLPTDEAPEGEAAADGADTAADGSDTEADPDVAPADDPWAGLLPLGGPEPDPEVIAAEDLAPTEDTADDVRAQEPVLPPPPLVPPPPAVPPAPAAPLVPTPPPGPPPTAPPPPPGPPPTAHHEPDPSTQLLVPVPEGPVGVLVLPDGSRVELDRAVVLGRSPAWDGPDDRQLVVVKSPFGDVSRSHAAVTVHDGRAWVEDLGSTNGTLLAQPAGEEHLLDRGRPEALEPGALITLAKDVTVVFESA